MKFLPVLNVTAEFKAFWKIRQYGDSDVGDIVMIVTDLRCWWQNHYVGDFFRYVGDFHMVISIKYVSMY